MNRYHKDTSIRQVLHLTVNLDEVVNFYVLTIDSQSNNVKQFAINTEPGFNSDDITVIDNKTVEVIINASENANWLIGNFHFQIFALYTDSDFEDAIRIESNSRAVFRLVNDNVPTQDSPDIEMNLPYNAIPDAPINGDMYGRQDGDWEVIGAGTGDMTKATYDTDNSGVVDDAEKVNGMTVETAVPAGAVFTDTIYDDTNVVAHINDANNPHYVTAEQISVTDTSDYFNSSNVEGALGEIMETKRENGWDLLEPDSQADISFSEASRTVTLSIKSGQSSYNFWVNNHKIIKTSNETAVIPDITGSYYVVYNNLGNLEVVNYSNLTVANFYENAITAYVYWNATTQKGMLGNEMHGRTMDSRTHHYNHDTFGARYANGLNISGLVDGSSTYNGTTSGVIWDEDIMHSLGSQATNHFVYRSGADGAWVFTTPDDKVSYTLGGSYHVWNEWDGTTWKLTEGANLTDYWIIFMIASPDASGNSLKKIIGQNAYSSRSKARAAIETERSRLSTEGLVSPEFVFLYAWIVRRDGTLEDDGDGNAYYDLRTIGGASGTSAPGQTASDISVDVTNFDGILSSTDTDVQTALNTIDNRGLSGITASRPAVTSIGYTYFDTTLGMPIWFDGTTWVNATGTSV